MEIQSCKETLNIGRRIIVFIGPEGSGKTTMAKRLAAASNKPYITTGDIIRDLAANDQGTLGDECRKMFADRRYLDGDTLLKILTHRFVQADVNSGFVLDGGLRTLGETIGFQAILEQSGNTAPLVVIHMRIPAWMSLERLALGKFARKRNDDTVDGILSRLSKFYFQLAQRSSVMQKNWQIVHIDALAAPEEVYQHICKALEVKVES